MRLKVPFIKLLYTKAETPMTTPTTHHAPLSHRCVQALARHQFPKTQLSVLLPFALLLLSFFNASAFAQGSFGLAVPVPFGNGMSTFNNFDSGAVTVETWIRVNEFNADHGEPVQYVGGNGVAWQFYLQDAGSLRMTAAFQVGGTSAACGPILTRGVWHHIAGSFDTQLIRLYVDGNLVAQVARAAGIPGAGSSPQVKCAVKMRCDMDEIRIWNITRRADQIQCSKNAPFTTPLPAGLVAYWPIDNGFFDRGWKFPSLVNGITLNVNLVNATLIQSGATFSAPPTMTLTVDGPTTQTAAIGSPAYFGSTAVGITPASYTWQVQNPGDPSGWTFLAPGAYNIPGLPSFSISVAGPNNSGIVVTPLSGVGETLTFRPTAGAECFYAYATFPNATLLVTCSLANPSIGLLTSPTRSVAHGQPCYLPILVTGDGTFSYRWEMLDALSPGGWQPLADGLVYAEGSIRGLVSASGTSAMTFTPYPIDPVHRFRCRVTQTVGTCSATGYSSEITVLPCTVAAPFSLLNPDQVNVQQGNSIVLQGTRPGTGPFVYQWEVYDSVGVTAWRRVVDGQTTVTGTGPFTFSATGSGTQTLTVQPLGAEPQSAYFRLAAVRAETPADRCSTSYSNLVTVNSCTAVPTVPPSGQPQSQAVAVGQTLTISAMPTPGLTGVTVQWRRHGANIINGNGGAAPGGGTVSGATGSLPSPTNGTPTTLTITNAQPSDSGAYTAVFTNACGNFSSAAANIIITGDNGPCASSFAVPVNYAVGTNPISAVVGDFNADGRPDLAVANPTGNNVSVMLGNANGTFQGATSYTAGSAPVSIAVGDFNGDGTLDMAVANAGSNNVSILLRNADGTFQAPVNYAAGSAPSSIAVGDFNADGRLDLAVANDASNTVSIFLGSLGGLFQAAVNYPVGNGPVFVVVHDLNADGRPDLAVAIRDSSGIAILLGNGTGTFQGAVTYITGLVPTVVAVGDFNSDGQPDLAVPNYNSNNVSILLGNANGQFSTPVNYPVGPNPRSVTVGDFNGDGRPDLAVANDGTVTVSILRGNSNGTFQEAVNYVTGIRPHHVTTADFNADSKPDLAVTNYGSNNVSVLLNTIPNAAVTVSQQPLSQSVAAGQTLTLSAAPTPGLTGVSVQWRRNGENIRNGSSGASPGGGNVSGANGPLPSPATSTPSMLTITNAQSSDSGFYSAIFSNTCGSVTSVDAVINITGDIGQCAASFRVAVNYSVGTNPISAAIGDFNADGRPDLAVANPTSNDVSVLLGNANGTFLPAVSYAAGSGPDSIAVGDFNGDGRLDMAVANFGSNNVSILLRTVNGTFQAPVNYAVGSDPSSIAVGDFNADGTSDLVVANSYSNNASILLGNPNGTFQTAVSYTVGVTPNFVAVGDFNGDGRRDLAVANSQSDTVSILLGNGTGTFQGAVNYAVGFQPIALAVGDFNADGRPDLAVANYLSNTVSILLGNANGTFFCGGQLRCGAKSAFCCSG